MSKITLDNLSDNLKAYLEGLGLSEEQVLNLINENGLDEEELKTMLKDTMSINELNTNSKTVIGAINELSVLFNTLNIKYEELKNTVNEGLQVIECVSLTINKSTMNLDGKGVSAEIIATVLPSNCNEELLWVSSNPDVATVNNGVVTTVNVGSCTIIAICGSKSVYCQLNVTNTAGVLIANGVDMKNPTFGSVITYDGMANGRVSFNSSKNRLEIFNIGDYQVLSMGFNKYFENLSGVSKIRITAFTESAVNTKPELIIAVRSNSRTTYTATNPFENGEDMVRLGTYKEMTGGTTKTVYELDMTTFHGVSGYLAIGFRMYTNKEIANICITDIELV